ncbi:SLAM family member 8-like [Brachyhypopomus gauderio]|uniref:SLAM family member 8-like n=1 Tax=Brachyhypopomus gauderio TaxID=698409 RepID=UPI004042C811
MKAFNQYCASYSGILLFGIIQGLCAVADVNTVTEHRTTGGSLLLPLGWPKENVSYAEWRFNGNILAVYIDKQIHKTNTLQFEGRLKVDNITVSVEVEGLQVQDSGTFSIVADRTINQFPTKTINLTVDARIETVTIQSDQTWLDDIKACEVHVWCQASDDQSASYTWSGYQNGSGALLHFTLPPAEGDITLICTAVNSVSNQTATKPLACRPEQPETGPKPFPWIMWAAVGAGVLLIITVVVASWWKCHKDAGPQDSGNTVYADVSGPPKDKRTQSIVNGASIYETVDELRVTSDTDKPQTLYDKVTFARPTRDYSTVSSPYQKVL